MRCITVLSLTLGLAACTPAEEEPATPASAAPPVTAAGPASDAAPYDTSHTLEDLMNAVVMPNAEQLWNAVSYVATTEGVTETQPETAEDWDALRNSAVTLIEAGNLLLIPGREILSRDFDSSTAAFQLTPDEIREAIVSDPEPWRNYVQQLQDTTRMTLQAIERRDLMGLVEFGAEINEACEGCHASYWYRAPGTMVPQ